jgi:hypothetical protein
MKIKTPKPRGGISFLVFEREQLVPWHEHSLIWPELT